MKLPSRGLSILALVVATSLAACATSAPAGGYAAEEATVVEVTNNNSSRITVSAVSLGMDRRLGDVETNGTASFTLPRGLNLADVQILLDPIGPSGSFLTPRMVLHRGDVVRIRIPANLQATTYQLN